jgi:hypothetical protein
MKNSRLNKLAFCLGLLLVTSISTTAQNKKSDWTAFAQHVDVDAKQELKFMLLATVQADVIKRKGKAGLWARVDNKNGTTGFFENMCRKPIRKNTTETYFIEGVIDEKSKELFFGGIAYGNGTYTYDDFELYIENPKTKKMEAVKITNGNFEQTSKDKVNGWNIALENGADKNSDGFAVSLVSNKNNSSSAVQIVSQGK